MGGVARQVLPLQKKRGGGGTSFNHAKFDMVSFSHVKGGGCKKFPLFKREERKV